MRRAYSLLLAAAAILPLAGCYYDPGYVRSSQGGGDAYYGTETTTVVQDGGGFYDPGYGYGYGFGPGYYGGYNDIVLGSAWYGGRGYDRGYYRGRDGHDHDWHGRPGDGDHRPGGWQGSNRPGGWQGDHRPGGWQGGNRPPGGWQGGGRPPPPGGWHGGARPQGTSSSAHSAPRGNFNRGSGSRDGH